MPIVQGEFVWCSSCKLKPVELRASERARRLESSGGAVNDVAPEAVRLKLGQPPFACVVCAFLYVAAASALVGRRSLWLGSTSPTARHQLLPALLPQIQIQI